MTAHPIASGHSDPAHSGNIIDLLSLPAGYRAMGMFLFEAELRCGPSQLKESLQSLSVSPEPAIGLAAGALRAVFECEVWDQAVIPLRDVANVRDYGRKLGAPFTDLWSPGYCARICLNVDLVEPGWPVRFGKNGAALIDGSGKFSGIALLPETVPRGSRVDIRLARLVQSRVDETIDAYSSTSERALLGASEFLFRWVSESIVAPWRNTDPLYGIAQNTVGNWSHETSAEGGLARLVELRSRLAVFITQLGASIPRCEFIPARSIPHDFRLYPGLEAPSPSRRALLSDPFPMYALIRSVLDTESTDARLSTRLGRVLQTSPVPSLLKTIVLLGESSVATLSRLTQVARQKPRCTGKVLQSLIAYSDSLEAAEQVLSLAWKLSEKALSRLLGRYLEAVLQAERLLTDLVRLGIPEDRAEVAARRGSALLVRAANNMLLSAAKRLQMGDPDGASSTTLIPDMVRLGAAAGSWLAVEGDYLTARQSVLRQLGLSVEMLSPGCRALEDARGEILSCFEEANILFPPEMQSGRLSYFRQKLEDGSSCWFLLRIGDKLLAFLRYTPDGDESSSELGSVTARAEIRRTLLGSLFVCTTLEEYFSCGNRRVWLTCVDANRVAMKYLEMGFTRVESLLRHGQPSGRYELDADVWSRRKNDRL